MLAGVRVNAVTDNWLTKEAFRTIRERERQSERVREREGGREGARERERGMNHPSKEF